MYSKKVPPATELFESSVGVIVMVFTPHLLTLFALLAIASADTISVTVADDASVSPGIPARLDSLPWKDLPEHCVAVLIPVASRPPRGLLHDAEVVVKAMPCALMVRGDDERGALVSLLLASCNTAIVYSSI